MCYYAKKVGTYFQNFDCKIFGKFFKFDIGTESLELQQRSCVG